MRDELELEVGPEGIMKKKSPGHPYLKNNAAGLPLDQFLPDFGAGVGKG